jgi:hypothetical protein
MVAARHSYMLIFDNMSGVRDALSDDLSAMVTGTGISVRQLYTNFDEATFKAQRPIVINGIEELGTRGDFLERLLPITLPPISDEQRHTEDALGARLQLEEAQIVGALFDAVVIALDRIDRVSLDSHGRMADFNEWVVAAAPGLGCTEQEALDALARARRRTTDVALEASALVQPLNDLLNSKRNRFVGNASRLLTELEKYLPDGVAPRQWPTGPLALGNQLRRLTPDLRRAGIFAEPIPHGRKWRITRCESE